MSHLRLTTANEPSVLLEDDIDLQRRLGLVAVWDQPSEADITQLLRLMQQLPARQRAVIAAHFGLDGRRARSLRKVARELGMSPTHARRLERRALTLLRTTWPTPEVSR